MREIIRFYNKVSEREVFDMDEIPISVRNFLLKVPALAVITPFVIEDIEKGQSEAVISRKYSVGRQTIRTIKKEIGYY